MKINENIIDILVILMKILILYETEIDNLINFLLFRFVDWWL